MERPWDAIVAEGSLDIVEERAFLAWCARQAEKCGDPLGWPLDRLRAELDAWVKAGRPGAPRLRGESEPGQ